MSVSDTHLRVDGLNLKLGGFALRDIDLACLRGQYHILLGPSGSGKSSLMKSILGFHKVASGKVYLGERDITDELPERRRMGYVPQNYALFPHLSVEDNIRFGIKASKIPPGEADAQVRELCGMLGIEALLKRGVSNLSGGEQQKVALARALCTRPETILLDEPFSSIDEGGKRGLWFDLKYVIEEVGITALHITHNLEEAETLGEQLSVLIDGRLVQSGRRRDIFEHPSNERVARYLNYRNIFTGTAHCLTNGTRIDVGHFSLFVGDELEDGAEVTLCVRQQDLKIIKEGLPVKEELKRNLFNGRIVKIFPLLDHCLIWFRLEGSDAEFDFELKFPRHIKERHDLTVSKKLQVAIWEPKIIVL